MTDYEWTECEGAEYEKAEIEGTEYEGADYEGTSYCLWAQSMRARGQKMGEQSMRGPDRVLGSRV